MSLVVERAWRLWVKMSDKERAAFRVMLDDREIPKPKIMDPGVKEAVTAAGGMRPLASKLGVVWQTIQQWKKIPAERIIEVEKVTGVPRERLRPDLYRKGRS